MASLSQKKINYAKSIAKRRNDLLPPEAEVDSVACDAYIDTYKDSVPPKAVQPPSKPQEKLATWIFESLSDSISEQEFKRAMAESGLCAAFIQRHKSAFEEYKAKHEEEKCIKSRMDTKRYFN